MLCASQHIGGLCQGERGCRMHPRDGICVVGVRTDCSQLLLHLIPESVVFEGEGESGWKQKSIHTCVCMT